MVELSGCSLLLIFLVSSIVILSASEIGRRIGVRRAALGGDYIATLESAILSLLALMIGFTFAMALSRFEGRRDAVLNEANAIGTTALRARLLPAPHSTQALKLLREYVQVRLDITRRVPSAAELDDAIARSNALQEALWGEAKAAAAKDAGRRSRLRYRTARGARRRSSRSSRRRLDPPAQLLRMVPPRRVRRAQRMRHLRQHPSVVPTSPGYRISAGSTDHADGTDGNVGICWTRAHLDHSGPCTTCRRFTALFRSASLRQHRRYRLHD
jgi:hypothetical protein